MNVVELNEIVSKVNTIQNDYLKAYLSLKDSNDIALDNVIKNFNKNEALIYQAIEILKGVNL